MAGHDEDAGRRARPSRIAVWGSVAALILLPLFAMLASGALVWNPGNFAFAGALVVGIGVTYELAARITGASSYRAAVGVALVAALILTWMNLAVGIIGSEDNPANWMYGGVLAVGIVGAVIARFQPTGMARALFATAIAQVSVSVIALIAGFGFTGPITVFFTALWLISAWLFRKAARQ